VQLFFPANYQPPGRTHHRLIEWNYFLILMGGEKVMPDGTTLYMNDIWLFDPVTELWAGLNPMPFRLSRFCAT
jgi:hypothetical protein